MWDLGARRNCQRKCSAKRVDILVEKGGNIGGKGGKRVEIIGGNGSLGKGWKLRRYGVGGEQSAAAAEVDAPVAARAMRTAGRALCVGIG